MEKPKISVEMLDGERQLVALDDIIFIQVELKNCTFYLKNSTPVATIGLTKLWEMIKEAGKGYDFYMKKVGRECIINLDYLEKVIPSENKLVFLRDAYRQLPSKTVKKGIKEQPKDVMRHVQALKKMKKEPEPDNAIQEVPKQYYDVIIHEQPMRKLLKDLKKEKRIAVLGNYAMMKELTVPVEELNDEYHTEVGYEYVDLGLPSGTLWSTQDLNEGSYFAWGELYENDVFDENEYIHKSPLDSLVDDKTSTLSLKYDAARHFRGGGWRMPTKEECEELLDKCILSWCITQDKKHGCLLTGPNGNRIFIQANGNMQGDRLRGFRNICSYWSSSYSRNDRPMIFKIFEYEDETMEINAGISSETPHYGLPIRPVISKGGLTEEEGKMKRMLILESFCSREEDRVKETTLSVMDGWIIRSEETAADPKEAKMKLKNILQEFNPDVVVAFRTACIWAQLMKGRTKFLIEPDTKMSSVMKWYMEVEQEGLEEKDCLVSQDMIDVYESIEDKLAKEKFGDDFWILAEEPWDIEDPQLENCKSVELMPTADSPRWKNTRLFPIIKEITNGNYRDENGRRSPYGNKYNL